jgi:hypothetical protein
MFKDVLLQSRMLLLRQDSSRSIYEFECGIKRGKTLIENKNIAAITLQEATLLAFQPQLAKT